MSQLLRAMGRSVSTTESPHIIRLSESRNQRAASHSALHTKAPDQPAEPTPDMKGKSMRKSLTIGGGAAFGLLLALLLAGC
ncbi:MAG: hypothetical protein ACREUF_01390, partial [Solimonas sp.]